MPQGVDEIVDFSSSLSLPMQPLHQSEVQMSCEIAQRLQLMGSQQTSGMALQYHIEKKFFVWKHSLDTEILNNSVSIQYPREKYNSYNNYR